MIRKLHFYHQDTGLFTGEIYLGDPELVIVPDGCATVDAEKLPSTFSSWRAHKVVNGEVVPHVPPKPDATASWSEPGHRWVTVAERESLARSRRDQLLRDSDWMITRAIDLGEQPDPRWRAYRQALRDISKQPGFPDDVEWPKAPEDR